VALIVQAAGIALPSLVGGVAPALISAVLFGATFLGVGSIVLALGAHLQFPRAVALLTTGYSVGQILGPVIATPLLHNGYHVALLVGAYVAVAAAVMLGLLPTLTLLTTLSLPVTVWLLHQAEKGAAGSLRSIALIDLYTARLHTLFGVLLLAGLISARLLS